MTAVARHKGPTAVLDADSRAFVDAAQLAFVASANRDGRLDVSPRGGQPSVMIVDGDGTLLLPDYLGNRRLDTMGNLLEDARIAVLLLRRGVDTGLLIRGTARITTDPVRLACFPADENPALAVLEIQPEEVATRDVGALLRAGAWPDRDSRQPALDLGALIDGDKSRGGAPVLRDAREEAGLERSGLRQHYGPPSEGVRTKVTATAGPGLAGFLAGAEAVVLASRDDNGQIDISVSDATGMALDDHGRIISSDTPSGLVAMSVIARGRAELVRVNGEASAGLLTAREMYFHCSAALSRARLWQADRRVTWVGRRRFLLTARDDTAPGVVSFTLTPDDTAPLGIVLPGEYVTLHWPDRTQAAGLARSYSISACPVGRSLRITVRRIGAGGLSDLLHDHLQPGDRVCLTGPAGRFTLNSAPGRPVVLVSAGVGITPLFPMLEALAREETPRDVWFAHAARSGAHRIFRDEAIRIADEARAARIRVIDVLSRPAPGDSPDHAGRLDAATLARLVPVAGADIYICGPDPFMSALRADLPQHGADPSRIRTETFAAGQGGPVDLTGLDLPDRCKVTFAQSGRSVDWTPAAGTLLDLAEASGLTPPSMCRTGDCQTCVQRLRHGRVAHAMPEPPMLAEDRLLLCQAVPLGDIEIDC